MFTTVKMVLPTNMQMHFTCINFTYYIRKFYICKNYFHIRCTNRAYLGRNKVECEHNFFASYLTELIKLTQTDRN